MESMQVRKGFEAVVHCNSDYYVGLSGRKGKEMEPEEKEIRKICPILSATSGSAWVFCEKENCAWYGLGLCAIAELHYLNNRCEQSIGSDYTVE